MVSSPDVASESTSLLSRAVQEDNTSNRSLGRWRWIVPETNPAGWAVVNVALLLWSFILLCQLVFTNTGPLDRPNGPQWYMVWNFGTTAVWCVEIGLLVGYHGIHSTWSDQFQLLLSFYFLFDSVRLFRKWRNPHEDIEEELFDIVISMLAYLWVFLAAARNWWFKVDREPREELQSIQPDPVDEPIQETSIKADNAPVEESIKAKDIISTVPTKPPAPHQAATPPVVKKFPQFFRLKEGWQGWGHSSQLGSSNLSGGSSEK